MIPPKDIRLVMLDRDGVINQDSPDYIKSVDEWHPIEGSIEAIARLSKAGIVVCVATNQAGIGRGLISLADLTDIHQRLIQQVLDAGGLITHIAFCPHHPDDGCQCRKPAPGMLLTIGDVTSMNLSGQPFVGDSTKDVEAANAAGCSPVIVMTGNGVETTAKYPDVIAFENLSAFAAWAVADRP